jgi:hypothetical protein
LKVFPELFSHGYKKIIKEKPCAPSFFIPAKMIFNTLYFKSHLTEMVDNGTNIYAKFHHNSRLQGSMGVLVSHVNIND